MFAKCCVLIFCVTQITDAKLLTINTPNRYRYIPLLAKGIDIRGKTNIRFGVQACNDAHIALSRNVNNFRRNMFEIVLGGWRNSLSVLRTRKQGRPISSYRGRVVDCKSIKWFLLDWSNRTLTISQFNNSTLNNGEFNNSTLNNGEFNNSAVIMESGPLRHDLNFIGISTGFGSSGTWKFNDGSIPCQQWTEWFDDDDPETGKADFEGLALLRKNNPGKICERPSDIEAQLLDGRDYTAGRDKVKISPAYGFSCFQKDQSDRKCHDYTVRFCCDPEETGFEATVTCDNQLQFFTEDGEVPLINGRVWTRADQFKLPNTTEVLGFKCRDRGGIAGIKGMFRNGIKTDASWKCTNESEIGWTLPGFDDSGWQDASIYTDRRWGKRPFALNGEANWIWTSRGGADREVYCRKLVSSIVESREPECRQWTDWFDIDDPSGKADYESLTLIRNENPGICSTPSAIEAQLLDGRNYTDAGEIVTISPSYGFSCFNIDQSDGTCEDYRVRFCCDTVASTPKCNDWTDWYDRDTPTGLADYEKLSILRTENEGEICETPSLVQAQLLDGRDYTEAGDKVKVGPVYGLTCFNDEQVGGSDCQDYKVRFCCNPECPVDAWTKWFDSGDPTGTAEFETLEILRRVHPGDICKTPSMIEAQLLDGRDYTFGGDDVTISPTYGLSCLNREQVDGQCHDYKVRFCCPKLP